MAQAKTHPKNKNTDKDPNFMVQLNEPRMLRKDLLESIREIIIFMQGYEKFRKIQEDKVTQFTQLKTDIRVLTALVDDKLHKYLPKGKLKSVQADKVQSSPYERNEEPLAISKPTTVAPETSSSPHSELEMLEKQLQEIEGQLRTIG